MSPEPYTCDLDPDTKTTLKMYLFTNVQNTEEIRKHIIKGEWSCAVVKPSLILDPFQVAVAANRAVLARKLDSMVTRTVFGEILYNLSLTKNISQSLSKFGIEKGQDLLICFLATGGKDDSGEILSQVDGEPRPMSELGALTDMREVRSAYKLNNVKGDVDVLDVVVSRMVTKSFVSH